MSVQGWKFCIITQIYNILLQLSCPSPLESVMERVKDTFKGSIVCNLMLLWRLIYDGVTEQNSRTMEKYWSHWNDYCKEFGTDTYLNSLNPCEQSIILTEFVARVHTGDYGQGDQVCVQYILDAITAIFKTFQTVG